MSAGTIIEVDPSALTIALNVRKDTKVDKGFVASIKELGILQPPMVVANTEGGYDVVLGQRRTLAAVEAGLSLIPVYLVDQDEAQAARIIDQITENEQRQELSEIERVGGYKELALIGISPAQMAKKTGQPRKHVDAALAVGGHEQASAALVEHNLTLDEAAQIVEFEDDPAAVKALVAAAAKGQLEHEVASLRRKRDLEAAKVRLTAELKAEKVIVMLPSTSSYGGSQDGDPDGLVRLDKLGRVDDPTQAPEVADVPKKALAGRVVVEHSMENGAYGLFARKQYFVLNPAEHGIPDKTWASGPARELTPDELAAKAVRDAQDEERAALSAARQAAAEVRWAWVAEFVQRKTLPDLWSFIASMTIYVEPRHDAAALALVGVVVGEGESVAGRLLQFIGEQPGNGQRLLLAAVLAGAEDAVSPSSSWRRPDFDAVSVYLPQLDGWGYGLSEAEHALIADAAEESAAERGDSEDDDAFEGDDYDEDSDE